MSIMRRFGSRLLDKGTLLTPPKPQAVSQETHDWVVTYEIGTCVLKYFRWDRDEVWRWTQSVDRATRFQSEESARREVESSSMAWRYAYAVRKITE